MVSLALKWKLAVRSFLDFQARGPRYPQNVMEVRYEDLVDEPEAVIRRICAFVGEPYDPKMLAHQDHSGIKVSALPWKTGVTKAIYGGAVDRWRQELTGPRLALVQWLTAPEMRHYGYQPLPVSAADRARMPAQFVREFQLWLAYKRRQREERRQAGPQYYDDSGVYRMMLGLLGRVPGARSSSGSSAPIKEPLPSSGRAGGPPSP